MTARGCAAHLPRRRARGRQDLRHARRGPAPRRTAAPTSSSASSRPTAASTPPSRSATCRSSRRRTGRATAAAGSRRWTSTPCLQRHPQLVARRRARAYQRARLGPAREALAGHRDAARRRHRRDQHGQRAAPRIAQRRGRDDHRRARSARPCRTRSCAPPSRCELVDMTPEALRRRMAHGNIYPPGEGRCRAGQLLPARATSPRCASSRCSGSPTASRRGCSATASSTASPARGRPASGSSSRSPAARRATRCIRRAARIAARSAGGELMAVHVSRSDGLSRQRRAGARVAATARRITRRHATTRWSATTSRARCSTSPAVSTRPRSCSARRDAGRGAAVLAGPGTGQTVTRLSGPIDVHIVSHDYAGRGFSLPRLGYGLSMQRRLVGALVAAVLLAVATPLLAAGPRQSQLRQRHVRLPADRRHHEPRRRLLGGTASPRSPAACCSTTTSPPPIHTFTIDRHATTSSRSRSSCWSLCWCRGWWTCRRGGSALAARQDAEAETLAALAGSLLRGEQATRRAAGPRARDVRDAQRELAARDATRPTCVAGVSSPRWAQSRRAVARPTATRRRDRRGTGARAAGASAGSATISACSPRSPPRWWSPTGNANWPRRRSAVEPLAESERARTALLNAVSHDLRTPIASAKAAVSSLLAADVPGRTQDRAELLAAADDGRSTG